MIDNPDGSVSIITLTNDVDDRPEEEHYVLLGTFLEPAMDNDKRVMQINTRQQYEVYANQYITNLLNQSVSSNRQLMGTLGDYIIPGQSKRYDEFKGNQLKNFLIGSDLIRHGIGVSDIMHKEHMDIRTIHDWKEWIV